MYDDNFQVDVGEHGRVETRMRGIGENDAAEFVAQLIHEKHKQGYWIIDTRPSFVLMQNAEFKPFAIRIRRFVEAKAS